MQATKAKSHIEQNVYRNPENIKQQREIIATKM